MKKVLVIEDEPFARQVFRQLIEKVSTDVEIIEAADGIEAWDKIKECVADLLIVDINLPFINGIDLIEKLRIKPEYKDTPCIVVTANTSSEIQKKVAEYGVVEVISKIDVSSRVTDDNPLVKAIQKYLN